MPTQQRSRLHQQPAPERAKQQPCEPSQHRTVGPAHLGSGDLSAEHRDLVPQHQ
jgi:hypothetical protein